jgi:Fe-S-cluster containining protein
MSASSAGLPIIESCDGCGACCLVVTRPPFYFVFAEFGEAALERLQRERPDLVAELEADDKARKAVGAPSYGTPCLWYDAVGRRCRHYEYRPLACHEFEVGGDDCHDARRRAGIGEPLQSIRRATE